MILLTTSAHPTMLAWAHPYHGRLLTLRHHSSAAATAAAGIPWAADNDGFGGVDVEAFERMLERLARLPGCRFVAAPDVVGDAWLTERAYWEEYASLIYRHSLPPAYVLQDGLQDIDDVPWGSCKAVFLGGSDPFRRSELVRAICAHARERRRWIHVGRVNSNAGLYWAAGLGADSADGSGWAIWRNTNLARGLAATAAATLHTTRQGRLL
jgi:hypothetical protein